MHSSSTVARSGVSGREKILIGDVVIRTVSSCDSLLLNRQPSLDKHSILSFRIGFHSHNTLCFNPCLCAEFNADFDGDEMNVLVAQSLDSSIEVSELMMVPFNIISPQFSRPVIGIVQDCLLGSFLLTSRNTLIYHALYHSLCAHSDGVVEGMSFPYMFRPFAVWTGKQLLALLLPSFDYRAALSQYADVESPFLSRYDTVVIVSHGVLLCGVLTRESLGCSSQGIIHCIWRDHGPVVANLFISELNRIVTD
jgi:DNA-directed RNA polymerase II subunit RPB1